MGYGVCLDRADALIEYNLFDKCRHHIAGTGSAGTSYEACHNIAMKTKAGHLFDMHGDGHGRAGDRIKIHHNTFKETGYTAVLIRGRPAEGAEIHHNWFFRKDPKATVRQWGKRTMRVYRNCYGPGRVVK